MSKRRFELSDGTSDKFWEVEVVGTTMTVTFGRIGTQGTAKDKTFSSKAEAEKEATKLIGEKTKKGYQAATSGKPAPSKATSGKPAPSKATSGKPAPSKATSSKAASSKAAAPTTKPADKAKAAVKAKAAPEPAEAKAPAKTTATKSTVTVPKTIRELLDTIAAKEKWLVKELREPASAEALAKLRELEVPDALLALYSLHDGTKNEFMGPYRLLPVASIEDERTMMNQLLAENPTWAKDGNWDSRWVPFMADGDGQYYCIDPGGSCNAGKPGQVLFYDHESGPEREFTSFDAFVGLLTALAKKKLLSERAREDKEETIEALTAEAKAVGLPKLPPKQLKAVLQQLEGEEDEPAPSAEQRLALLEPLVRQYGAEEQLWSEFATAAAELERWPLVIEAASAAYRIAPKDSKPWHVPQLALALHRTGKDEEALGWLRKAVEIAKNPNSSRVGLIHEKVDPAFHTRCLQLITELHPSDEDAWMLLGSEANDPAVRQKALKQVIAVVDGMRFGGYAFDAKKLQAQRLLEHDRIAAFSADDRLKALLEFAAKAGKGKDPGLWTEAAAAAIELGQWKDAERAGGKAVEHSYDFQRDKVCHLQVRALYELGREKDALAALRASLEPSYGLNGTEAFKAIPWQAEREAGNLERSAKSRAFEDRCFALVTELSPDNLEAWKWRRKLASGADRIAVLKHLDAVCAEAPNKQVDGEPYYAEEDLAELARLHAEVRAELERA